MNNTTDIELIERYLLGKMTDADKRSFENRLYDDRELARKLRLIRTFPEMMSEQGRIEFEKNRVEASAKAVKKKSFRFPKPRYILWTAFSAIALTGIALVFMWIGHRKENIIRKENVAQKENIKTEVATIKDTAGVMPRNQPEMKKIPEVLNAVQKAIELLTPAEGMNFSGKEAILFKWIQKTDTFTRFYIVSELNDQVVFWRGIRPGVREYKVPVNYLYPGTYYWYVGRKEVKHTFTVSE
jgi:hypothetical protein